ncbi:hypothetical protein I6E31_00980 [Fusobacterium varium]|nr:hypothetical protein [Fusobacterium varium]
MESGDIITEKKDEKSSEIFDELQQKKLFAEKELEIKSQGEEKKEVETQENTLADITEEKVLSAEENLKIEKEEKIEVQETSTNNESEKEEVNLKEATESEIVSEEPEEEKKDEIIVENVVAENLEEKRDPKDITILTDNDDVRLVESGLEIQYTSLHLNNFPISYSNFSNELSFNEVISIGTSAIKIGETLLNNTSLKILVYDKFKLLEIKTREFKVALSIDLLNGETLVKNGDFYKYEIFNKIKNSRFIEVINIFKEIFSGAKIEFKFKKLVGDITFENRIEVYKFNLLQELANSYKNIVNSFSLNREKNFAEVTNSFYEVFLTEAILEGKKIDSWINFRLKNDFDIQAGDNLTFERIHKLDFKGINFDIKEIIKVKSEVSEREFTKDNEICGYRRAVEISLKKVEKFN